MITINLGNLTAELTAAISDHLDDVMLDIFVELSAPPPAGTPVDQGTARNGWQLDTSVPLAPTITNSVPYINRLNNGHSQQSPAGFVEAAIDKFTR